MKVIELNRGFATIVDDEDFPALAQYRWHINTEGYAARSINFIRADGKRTCRSVRMHREIMTPLPGFLVDHANQNKLDNRRCNLRIATISQNNANSKCHSDTALGIKGVIRDPKCRSKPFRARIRFNKKLIDLGYFQTAEEAHAAYCEASTKFNGPFARFN